MKKRTYLSLLLLLPLLFSFSSLHEYYVSVTKVVYVKDQKAIQITNQVFIDDFEALLIERYDDNVTLGGDDEPKVAETYIERYLTDKIVVKVNGAPVSVNYIGREYKDDIVYAYLEIVNISDVKSISITNEVLFDMFEEQQNIIKTNINSKKKSFLLTSAKTNRVLNFD
ncbi:DUF6702 family protein [Winogradskyella sp. A3E31]|uniref:DUF6702 family protein n=1 Tax=Winogradskyella sp. A3E31 TaxID=3349637 RepID=UPI00398AF348